MVSKIPEFSEEFSEWAIAIVPVWKSMRFSSLFVRFLKAIRSAPVEFCGREKWSQNVPKTRGNRCIFEAFFEAIRNAPVEFCAFRNMLYFSSFFASFSVRFDGYPQCSGGILWSRKMEPKCIQNGMKSMLFWRFLEAKRNAPVEFLGFRCNMQKWVVFLSKSMGSGTGPENRAFLIKFSLKIDGIRDQAGKSCFFN